MREIRASGLAGGGAALPLSPPIGLRVVLARIFGEEDEVDLTADQQRRRERKGEEDDAGRIDVCTPPLLGSASAQENTAWACESASPSCRSRTGARC